METLATDSAFKRFLTQETETSQKFNTLKSKIDGIFKELKKLRNDTGGHIRHEALKEALSAFEIEPRLIQIGDASEVTHFKFALDAVILMFTHHLDLKQFEKFVIDCVSIAELLFGDLDQIILSYFKYKKRLS